jgi:hypothetical protein
MFSSTHIDRIFSSLSIINPKLNDSELHALPQFLNPIAGAQPNLFDKHLQTFLRIAIDTQNTSAFYCLHQYFVSSSNINGEKVASDHLITLISLLQHKGDCAEVNRTFIIRACELIGASHIQVLGTKRADFVALNCTQLVHLIDSNKMTEENKHEWNDLIERLKPWAKEFKKLRRMFNKSNRQ